MLLLLALVACAPAEAPPPAVSGSGHCPQSATFWPDLDADGFGHAYRHDNPPAVLGCWPPDGYADNDGDCDDERADVHPGATEICDPEGLDEDCDAATTWRYDRDGDGFGGDPSLECDATETFTAGDCDDADPATSPAGTEICGDGLDQDCSGNAAGCGVEGAWWPQDLAESGLPGRPFAAGDTTGDGLSEVLVGVDGELWLVSAASPEVPLARIQDPRSYHSALLDLTGDGRAAALVVGSDESRYELRIHWAPTGILAASDATIVADVGLVGGADLDGDGATELILRGSPGVGVVPEPPVVDAQLAEIVSLVIEDGAAGTGGDLDGDGRAELIVHSSSEVGWFPSDATGVRVLADADGSVTGTAEGFEITATVPGDLDGDGYAELAIHKTEQSSPGDYDPLHGTALFYGPLDPVTDLASADAYLRGGVTGHGSAAGDLDGDGTDDLITWHRHGGGVVSPTPEIALYLGAPIGTEPKPDAIVYDEGWGIPAQLDGDGYGDLILDGATLLGGPGW